MKEITAAKEIINRLEKAIDLDIEELHASQGDLKALSKEDFEKLKLSIKTHGFLHSPHVYFDPAVQHWQILDGHSRVLAAKALRSEGYYIGKIKCMAVIADSMADAMKYILLMSSSYGKMSQESVSDFFIDNEIDFGEMGPLLDLPNVDLDIGDIRLSGNEGLTDPDLVPEPPKVATSKLGDIYKLGHHRLMCGDSTNADHVGQLMAGELADFVFTDPPYGVNYDGGHADEGVRREKLANDDSTEIYDNSVPLMVKFSKPTAALYLWFAATKSLQVLQVLQVNKYEIRSWLIWNKNMAQFGAIGAQYKQKHEPCLYCYKKGTAPFWGGPTNEVSVWDVSRASKNEYHPTQKPVELSERAIKNSCPANGIVLDLFGGSGSTMLGCEITGRSARLMELNPIYVDVIVARWEAFTGLKAELVSS